jgi:hypothetical protein
VGFSEDNEKKTFDQWIVNACNIVMPSLMQTATYNSIGSYRKKLVYILSSLKIQLCWLFTTKMRASN